MGKRVCPESLDGMNVICWTFIDERHRPTGKTEHIIGVDGELMGPAAGLAICKNDEQGSCMLLYCDENWNPKSDTWHENLHYAKDQAEFEYEGSLKTWQQPSQ